MLSFGLLPLANITPPGPVRSRLRNFNPKTKTPFAQERQRRRKRRRSIKLLSPVVTRRASRRRKLLPQVCCKQSSVCGSNPCKSTLLGNVNLLFLVHMAQEQQQRASAKNYRQHDRNYAMGHPS